MPPPPPADHDPGRRVSGRHLALKFCRRIVDRQTRTSDDHGSVFDAVPLASVRRSADAGVCSHGHGERRNPSSCDHRISSCHATSTSKPPTESGSWHLSAAGPGQTPSPSRPGTDALAPRRLGCLSGIQAAHATESRFKSHWQLRLTRSRGGLSTTSESVEY
jgi:hypothetical protein